MNNKGGQGSILLLFMPKIEKPMVRKTYHSEAAVDPFLLIFVFFGIVYDTGVTQCQTHHIGVRMEIKRFAPFRCTPHARSQPDYNQADNQTLIRN